MGQKGTDHAMKRYNTSRPCEWVEPRRDGGMSREWVHGPLQPMDVERWTPRLRLFSALLWRFAIGFALVISAYHIWTGWRAFG